MSILTSVLGGGDLIREIGATVRQVLPNKEAQRDFDLKIAELADKANQREQELNLGQIDTNKEEAKNSNIFVAGWRPAMGWVSVSVVGYTYILAPFIKFGVDLTGHTVPLPVLDLDALWPVILGMLGLGAQRSYEKGKGVATSIGGKIMTPVKPVEASRVPPPIVDAPIITSEQKKPKKGWFD